MTDKTGTNLDYAETLRLARHAAEPRDEYLLAVWSMIYAKVGQQPETWRDRLVRKIAERLIALILRDPDIRRRLCLSIAGELREIDVWLDKPMAPPPKPHKD